MFPFHTSGMKANLLGALALIIGTSVLGACVGQKVIPDTTMPPTAGPPPAPNISSQQAAPPATTAWNDMPATPGDWAWAMEAGQSTARFAGARLTLRCNAATRSIQIERREPSAAPSRASTLTIRTQSTSRTLSVVPQGGALVASLAARDPLLDAMAFSRGRFAVESPNLPTLYVPSWTEISRTIEDCR